MITIGEPVSPKNDEGDKKLREAVAFRRQSSIAKDAILLLYRQDGRAGYDDGNDPDETWAELLNAEFKDVTEDSDCKLYNLADEISITHFWLQKRFATTSALMILNSGAVYFPDATPLYYWLADKRGTLKRPEVHKKPDGECHPIRLSDTTGHAMVALQGELARLFQAPGAQQAA